MKFNFRKISALATSALLIGMTAGVAAAANYPAPLVQSGIGDFAVVYGARGASTDQGQANLIASQLLALSSSVGLGSDTFKFERTSTKFHLGDNITSVYSSDIDDDELEALLADGIYTDVDNNEFDFTQKIVIGSTLQLGMFEDNDYAEDEPTIGFRIPSGTTVLTYTLDFTDEPLFNDLETTDLSIMGKTYYVLDVGSSNDTLTLLDSADDIVLNEGESKTVAGHTVSIAFISTNTVKLVVDGQTTNSLSEGQTQKLSDGSYVGIKDILVQDYQGGIKQVEFSIGSGKLLLTSGSDIQVNDNAVPGVVAIITNSTVYLSSIALAWSADDDLFITTTSDVTLPSFESVKLSFTGLNYPAEETIEIEQGGSDYAVLDNFPLKDGVADIPFLYGSAGAFTGLGKDSSSKLVTSADGVNMTFDADDTDWFVASWSDGNDGESYLMRATNFVLDGANNETDLQYYKNGVWTAAKTGIQDGDTFSIGNVDLIAYDIQRVGKSVIIGNYSAETNFNTVYSAEGLKVYLPVNSTRNGNVTTAYEGEIWLPGTTNSTIAPTGHNGTSFYLVMYEEDKDDQVGDGDWINTTIAWDSGTTPEVEVNAIATSNADATSTEIGDTDVWRDFTYSDLATEILFNKPSSGQKSVKFIYYGSEVTADVYITSTDVTGDAPELGSVLVTDAEVSTVQSRNLVVVGGSCINSVAAALVGGAYCTTAWQSATGVGAGQFLIQSYTSPYSGSKIALLVAGYNAEDTVNAATYVKNRPQPIDSAVGKKYIGTSATSAQLVVQ